MTPVEETMRALDDLTRQEMVRYVGVSNWQAWKIMKAQGVAAYNSGARFETLQAYYSIAGRDLEREIVPLLDDQKIGLMVWSPLAGGRLFDKGNEAAVRLAAAAAGMSAKYNQATLEQLAYAWILAHPSRPLPVIGTNKIERIESAAKSANITLDREDWYALWVAAHGHNIP